MRKGFTLIEIIVCIIILAVIGVSSFVGIRAISKNITTSKLEQITDRVLEAVEVYIETHSETKNQLYKNKNSVVVPLNALVNEGLLDLKGTTLEDKDIENEYVVTAFTNNSSRENCIDITSSTSWNLSKENPFYICSNESGTNNSIIIGGTTSNKDYTSNTRVYFTDVSSNYISFKNKTYRLLYIDKDDSLVLYTPEDTFGDVFNGKTQPIKGEETTNISDFSHMGLFTKLEIGNQIYDRYKDKIYNDPNDPTFSTSDTVKVFSSSYSSRDFCTGTWHEADDRCYKFKIESRKHVYDIISYRRTYGGEFAIQKDLNASNNEQIVGYSDFENNESLYSFVYVENIYDARTGKDIYNNITQFSEIYITKGRKIQLKACMRIAEGTGTEINPYKIKDMC